MSVIFDFTESRSSPNVSSSISANTGVAPANTTQFTVEINEKEFLKDSKDYIKKILSCDIEIFNAGDEGIYDPAKKAKYAFLLRPAIYLE